MYMNQTKKRLSIINLAISITDIETIQLQILKLGLLKTDSKIQEILSVLQAENYAKAQRLIKTYIDTPMEEILQRASQQNSIEGSENTPTVKKETIISEEDQKIIDEFQLFTTEADNTSTQTKKKVIDINDFLTETPDTPKKEIDTAETDFDALLNLKADDVMSNNIDLDISHNVDDTFFDIPEKEDNNNPHANVSRDTFFDLDEEQEELKDKPTEEEPFDSLLTVKTDRKASLIKDALAKQAETERSLRETISQKKSTSQPTSQKKKSKKRSENIPSDTRTEDPMPEKSKRNVIPEEYPPISYIRQKFVSMRKQYEPIQKGHDRFPTVETFLTTISQDGYKEKEIEETLNYTDKLITEEKFAEAAQLLLVCASTESQFAQLMLARELYRGVLLRKKVSEAFSILTHMADDNYPEALCDLGQFYENGIGTGRDKKVAKELYKKAMDLGIKRAQNHYERMKKKTKGIFRK